MAVLPTSLASDASAAARLLDDLVAKPGRSASMLLKDPATNTDESWHLCLPAHFNTALGLRFSCKQKVKNKQVVDRWREWSQGSHFCFNEGSIIYDRDVSGLTTWAEKLEAVDFFIVLGPTKPVTIRTLSTDTTGPRRIERDPGSVCFRIFFQDPDKSDFVGENEPAHKGEFIYLTQDEFVRFAISSELPQGRGISLEQRLNDALPAGSGAVGG
ncbi:MAG: hypothetical protein VKJ44_10575 [Synechococcus sp.]|nr:hypothetical protein [Synechococcus sp.]